MSNAARQQSLQTHQVRKGERSKTWYRRRRLFRADKLWFIRTREGLDVGPYRCEFDAEVESELLTRKLQHTPSELIDQVIRAHSLDAINGPDSLNSPIFTSYLVETGGAELLKDLEGEDQLAEVKSTTSLLAEESEQESNNTDSAREVNRYEIKIRRRLLSAVQNTATSRLKDAKLNPSAMKPIVAVR